MKTIRFYDRWSDELLFTKKVSDEDYINKYMMQDEIYLLMEKVKKDK